MGGAVLTRRNWESPQRRVGRGGASSGPFVIFVSQVGQDRSPRPVAEGKSVRDIAEATGAHEGHRLLAPEARSTKKQSIARQADLVQFGALARRARVRRGQTTMSGDDGSDAAAPFVPGADSRTAPPRPLRDFAVCT